MMGPGAQGLIAIDEIAWMQGGGAGTPFMCGIGPPLLGLNEQRSATETELTEMDHMEVLSGWTLSLCLHTLQVCTPSSCAPAALV